MKKIIFLIPLLFLAGCSVNFGASSNDLTSVKLTEKFNSSTEIKAKYTLDGSNLKRVAKDNPKDKIELTIGNDSNLLGAEKDFEPKVKIARWDDEVNLSLKPTAVDSVATKDKKLSFNDDKIVLETPKVNYQMYELPISADNPEGGFEYQVDLKEKPATNIIEFTLETKGLDFFYQPALNVEMASTTCSETDCGGSHRPENVVGSYAVYASENKVNYVGGKEYKTGQVGMFYRPQMEDANGTKVWGTLKIDKEKGILSVDIPQEFLDKAVYPIKKASGLVFGYDTQGGSTASVVAGCLGSLFTSPSDMATPTKISAYIGMNAGPPSMTTKLSISLNSDKSWVTNALTNAKTISGTTVTLYDYAWATPPSISASTAYWLMYGVEQYAGIGKVAYNSGSANQGVQLVSGLGATWFTPTYSTNKYSIYATYTAGGGATNPTGSLQIKSGNLQIKSGQLQIKK